MPPTTVSTCCMATPSRSCSTRRARALFDHRRHLQFHRLGLTSISGTGFQVDANIDTEISKLDTALNTLRTQASKFGSNLTTVQTRQDFTKNLINTLHTGADNLVLADTNEEGANLLALQTRQQLSTDRALLVGAGRPGGAALRLIPTYRIDERRGLRPRRSVFLQTNGSSSLSASAGHSLVLRAPTRRLPSSAGALPIRPPWSATRLLLPAHASICR